MQRILYVSFFSVSEFTVSFLGTTKKEEEDSWGYQQQEVQCIQRAEG